VVRCSFVVTALDASMTTSPRTPARVFW